MSNTEISPDDKPTSGHPLLFNSYHPAEDIRRNVSHLRTSDSSHCSTALASCPLSHYPHFPNPLPLLATSPTGPASTSASPTTVASRYQPMPGHGAPLLAAKPVEESAELQTADCDDSGSGGHTGQLASDGGQQPEEGSGQERQEREELGREQEQVGSQEQEELDRLYEERMEEEYAKREGGA